MSEGINNRDEYSSSSGTDEVNNIVPSYHHLKMPRTVLSKRQRHTPTSTRGGGVSSSSSVNQGGSTHQGTRNNDRNCGETGGGNSVSMTPSTLQLNIVDETDKTTNDINRKLRKKRKKYQSPSGSYGHHHHTCTTTKAGEESNQEKTDNNSGNSDENNESLKVYAFEKPLMNNNTNFKDNYFILTPVSTGSSSSNYTNTSPHAVTHAFRKSSTSSSAASPSSLTQHSNHSPHSTNSNTQLRKNQKFSPYSSSSSLTPPPPSSQHQSSATSQFNSLQTELQAQPLPTHEYNSAQHPNTTTFDKRLLVSEPNMTVYEKTPITTSMHTCNNTSNNGGEQQNANNLSLQMLSQIIGLMIQRYQHELGGMLQSPSNFVNNLLSELNQSQQIQNTNLSSENNDMNQSRNMLQLSIEDLMSLNGVSNSNPCQTPQNPTPQYQNYSLPNNSQITPEEIFAFILQNQHILFQNQQPPNNQF